MQIKGMEGGTEHILRRGWDPEVKKKQNQNFKLILAKTTGRLTTDGLRSVLQ